MKRFPDVLVRKLAAHSFLWTPGKTLKKRTKKKSTFLFSRHELQLFFISLDFICSGVLAEVNFVTRLSFDPNKRQKNVNETKCYIFCFLSHLQLKSFLLCDFHWSGECFDSELHCGLVGSAACLPPVQGACWSPANTVNCNVLCDVASRSFHSVFFVFSWHFQHYKTFLLLFMSRRR